MTGHIRKHQKLLWYFISAAVIVSFVAYFNPSSRLGGERAGNYGLMDGRPLSPAEVELAKRVTQFGEALNPERSRGARSQQEQEIYVNLLLHARGKELGIDVNDAAAATWVRQNFRDANGPIPYDKLLDRFVRGGNSRLTEEHLSDWIRQQVVRGHLADLVGVAGDLVTPREAAEEFKRENESLVVSLAVFSASNYLASVNLDPAALGQFYTNRLAVYRIPPRSVLTYVRFETTNYLAQANDDLAKIPDLTNRLELAYAERGPSEFTDFLGQPLSKAAALAKLRDEVTSQQALEFAARKATEFANSLYRITNATAATLVSEAQKRGLATGVTEPFAESSRPAALDDLPTLSQAMTKFSAKNPFTTPLRSPRGVVVAALTATLPDQIPTFAEVQLRVTEDYKRFRGQEAARAEGEAFVTVLTNSLAQGKSFAAVAAERQIRLTELPPFLISAQTIPGLDPRVNPNALKSAIFNLKPGTASILQPTADGGLVAFLKERRAVDDATLRAGLNSYLEEQRQQRKQYAFQEWLNREFEKSGLAARLKADSNDP